MLIHKRLGNMMNVTKLYVLKWIMGYKQRLARGTCIYILDTA